MPNKPKQSRAPKKTVGCRLEEEYRIALQTEAAKKGVEVSEVIRKLIVDGLREKECEAHLFEFMTSVVNLLRECRRDHALMTEALLIASGRFTPAKAREYAELHIVAP